MTGKPAPADATAHDLGGPVDETLIPVVVTDSARPTTMTLMAPGWRPPDDVITQSYAFCFTIGGGVVLVEGGEGMWNLPGGTINPGETPEDALVREIAEEACAKVLASRYIASQHVHDPANPAGLTSYFQSRWWASIRLDPWNPRHETVRRQVVAPDRFLEALSWREKTIAARLFGLALDINTRCTAK